MAEHFVTIEIDQGGARPHFTCTAHPDDDVDTSPCRWYCAVCPDECWCNGTVSWTKDLGYCRYIEGWFDDEPWELFEGNPTIARTAPVGFTWDGDSYWWHYADEPPQRWPKRSPSQSGKEGDK